MKQLYDKSMARTGFTLTLLAKGEVEIGSVCFPSKNCARTHMLPFRGRQVMLSVCGCGQS
jgi:hypothetical protein